MTTTADHSASRTGHRPRRSLAAIVLVSALGLGGVGGSLGFLTSPGVTDSDRQGGLAIPGVRGTGSGGGGGAASGTYALLLGRKAGGGVQEY